MSLYNIGAAEEGLTGKSLDTTQKETLTSKTSGQLEQDVLTAILATSEKETRRSRPKTPCPVSSARHPSRAASLLGEGALKGAFLKTYGKKDRLDESTRKKEQMDTPDTKIVSPIDSPKSRRGIVITPQRSGVESGEKSSVYTAVSLAGQSSGSSKSDQKERLMPEIHLVYGEQQGQPTKDVVGTPPDTDSTEMRSEVMTATGRRERVCEEITSSPVTVKREKPESEILSGSNHWEEVELSTAVAPPSTKQDELKVDHEDETRVELPVEKEPQTKVAAPQETDKVALELDQLIQKSLLIPEKVKQKRQSQIAVMVGKIRERRVQVLTSSSHSSTDSSTEEEVLGVSHEPEHSEKLLTARPLLKAKKSKASEDVRIVPILPQVKKELDLRVQKSALIPGRIKDQRRDRHAVMIDKERERSSKAMPSSSHSTIDSRTEQALCAGSGKELEQLVTLPKTSESEESQIALKSAIRPEKVQEKRQDLKAILIRKGSERSVKELVSTSHSSIEKEPEQLVTLPKTSESEKSQIAQIVPKTPKGKEGCGSIEQLALKPAICIEKVQEKRQDQQAVLVGKEREQSVKELLSTSHSTIENRSELEFYKGSLDKKAKQVVTTKPKADQAAQIVPEKKELYLNQQEQAQNSVLIPGKIEESRQDQHAVVFNEERAPTVGEILSSLQGESRREHEVLGASCAQESEHLVTARPLFKKKASKAGLMAQTVPTAPQVRVNSSANPEQPVQISALVVGKVNEKRQDHRAVVVSKEREQSVKELSSCSRTTTDSSLEREIFGFSRKHERLEEAAKLSKAKESKPGQVSGSVPKTPQEVKKAPCLPEDSAVTTARSAEKENLGEEAVPMAITPRTPLQGIVVTPPRDEEIQVGEEVVPVATTPRTPLQHVVITPTLGEEIREQGQLGVISQNGSSAVSVKGTPQRFIGESPAVTDRRTQSARGAVGTPEAEGHKTFLISDRSERHEESDLVAVNSHREKWYRNTKGTPRTGMEQDISTAKGQRAEDSQKAARAKSPYPKSSDRSEGVATAVEKSSSPKPAEFSLARIFPSLFGQSSSTNNDSSAPDDAASRPRPAARRPSPFTYPEQPARPKDARRDVVQFRSEYANKFTLGSRHTVDFFRGSYDDVSF
ncbi:hypothetical protein TELCIR_00387 [Teladorsagia circumcincta]|uniref:Uncharacterized protein n=1 Tax=Teladorsagia circumcincta TaxID=45464 RepID=A0A2G9V4U1_TELCI|nr:hypothetical protein TELCIR_00387 [Teladorsagia circumcincta]